MPESVMFHDGNRRLQDQFDSRRISDRLEEKLTPKEFSADDKLFVESLPYFLLATADDLCKLFVFQRLHRIHS